MKIAIASSGLGHIKRGMEGWSKDISLALHQRGIDVTLFKGAGMSEYNFEKVLPTIKRNSFLAKAIGKLTSKGGWRVGLGSAAGVESFFFGLQLLCHLRKGYDLVHLKQGSLAQFLVNTKKIGLHNVPIVLSNGQMAKREFLEQFDFVQHLTPSREDPSCKKLYQTKLSENRFIIPNFIDIENFTKKNKEQCREKYNLPKNAKIILTVGTVKKYHKRMDYFINEMTLLRNQTSIPLHFVIAGASDPETKQIQKLGKERLGDDLTILRDVSRESMPEIYSSADVFVLCSLFEAFGTCIIEAMACKLPVITHNNPSFCWITKSGGFNIDLEKNCSLSFFLKECFENSENLLETSQAAREVVVYNYSEDVVLKKIIKMYNEIGARLK